MWKTITGAMRIRTVGLTPGHRWCGGLPSVRLAVNSGRGAHGSVHGPNSLNATYIRHGRISDRPRKLARDLGNGHVDIRFVSPYGITIGTGGGLAKRTSRYGVPRNSHAGALRDLASGPSLTFMREAGVSCLLGRGKIPDFHGGSRGFLPAREREKGNSATRQVETAQSCHGLYAGQTS